MSFLLLKSYDSLVDDSHAKHAHNNQIKLIEWFSDIFEILKNEKKSNESFEQSILQLSSKWCGRFHVCHQDEVVSDESSSFQLSADFQSILV